MEAADYAPFLQPLSERLVKPALLAWCAREPQDARPFRWYNRYYRDRTYLVRALELDPSDDEARETLLGWWLYSLYYVSRAIGSDATTNRYLSGPSITGHFGYRL